jgi:hypothetical protein
VVWQGEGTGLHLTLSLSTRFSFTKRILLVVTDQETAITETELRSCCYLGFAEELRDAFSQEVPAVFT